MAPTQDLQVQKKRELENKRRDDHSGDDVSAGGGHL
jgi:hypothetical protein